MHDRKYSLTSFNHGVLCSFVKWQVESVASEKKLKVRLKLRNHKKESFKNIPEHFALTACSCCCSVSTDWEKAMAPHSSTLAWNIPWMEEPGGLQSMGSRKVRHDWVTSLSLFTFIHWRRKWQPTAVFLSGESQGQGSLVGCRLWGRTESDTTEAT